MPKAFLVKQKKMRMANSSLKSLDSATVSERNGNGKLIIFKKFRSWIFILFFFSKKPTEYASGNTDL